ncbi:MAG: hypothetical protein IIA07_02825 [Proteobacteria bacterium]|nr:hypothetical protein [Pseudomonadota bacterium]
MLLKQLLQQPQTSSKLFVCDPFREPDHEELVKEVIGLANADVDGPRYILFGVNAGAMEGSGYVGIADSAMANLKKAHRLMSSMIEPVLHLAFIYDKINSKLVGALEIDGCDEGPYVVGQDFSEELSRGRCWIREGRELRAVHQSDLASKSTPAASGPHKLIEAPQLKVGFNDQADCKLLEMTVPDTSDPPFGGEKQKFKKSLNLKQTIKNVVETVTVQILRLGKTQNTTASTDMFSETETIFSGAADHYYFEEKALQLNLCVCNEGTESIEDVSIELGFPRISDFEIADHLYLSPFDKRSSNEIKNLGYPNVEVLAKAIMVRSSLDVLNPGSPVNAFRYALRMAVGPGMQKKKIAIVYKLRWQNEEVIGQGRLKIQFGEISA